MKVKQYQCFMCDEWVDADKYLTHMKEHSYNSELPVGLELPNVMSEDVVRRWDMLGLLREREKEIGESVVIPQFLAE